MPHKLRKISRDPPSGSEAILEKLMGDRIDPPPLLSAQARVKGDQKGVRKPGARAKNIDICNFNLTGRPNLITGPTYPVTGQVGTSNIGCFSRV